MTRRSKLFSLFVLIFLTYQNAYINAKVDIFEEKIISTESEFLYKDKLQETQELNLQGKNMKEENSDLEKTQKKRKLDGNFIGGIIYFSILVGLFILNYIVLIVLCCRNYFQDSDCCWVAMSYIFMPLFAWIYVLLMKRWYVLSPQNIVNSNSQQVVASNLNFQNNNYQNNNQVFDKYSSNHMSEMSKV